MSSILKNTGWRSHNILENIDEQDSPKPDKFRKIPSSSSLNTLRMSLRKRMPLKQVEININAMPDWDRVGKKEKPRPLHSMTVTARNMFGAVSQKIKKTGRKPNHYLIASPDRKKTPSKQNRTPRSGKKSTPRTPRCRRMVQDDSPNPRVTPRSRAPLYTRRTNWQWKSFSNLVGTDGGNLRRSVRAASLNSPYSSPATLSRRRQFDKDLEAVSTGIRQLKRLSRVFDDAILKEERKEAIVNYHNLMVNNLRGARRPRVSWRSNRRLQHTLEGWTGMTLTSIVNAGAC